MPMSAPYLFEDPYIVTGANLVGMILNAVQPTRTGSRSYYAYGYGTPEDEKRRKRGR